jgi:hypothetical protein
MEALRETIYDTLQHGHPMTVRQVFYQLVIQGVIAKTENEYDSTVCRLLTQMRLTGMIPFEWIVDYTRWARQPATYGSTLEALEETARVYRRALWDDQGAYVEIWCEKDALSGLLYEVTSRWTVSLMPLKGQPSTTFVHGAAVSFRDLDRPIYLYYFGDSDKSGHDIERSTEQRLRRHAPHTEFQFERVAVTPDQIEGWHLPTRPDKTTGKPVVELDAIPPAELRALAEDCIRQHVDPDVLARTEAIEREERASLIALAEQWSER